MISHIDLRLLGGYNENISKNAQNKVIAALMEIHQELEQILN